MRLGTDSLAHHLCNRFRSLVMDYPVTGRVAFLLAGYVLAKLFILFLDPWAAFAAVVWAQVYREAIQGGDDLAQSQWGKTWLAHVVDVGVVAVGALLAVTVW